MVDFFLAFVPPRPDLNKRNIDDRTRNKDNRFATLGSGVKGGMKRRDSSLWFLQDTGYVGT